ncbi:NFACT RNA binding domain-containing protein, partial [Liquorilactobacillus nagelii]
KKYQKLKKAVIFVNEQLAKAQEEIAYLEEIQSEIELAEPEDLPEIKLELQQQGYLKNQKKAKKNKPRQSTSQPTVFYSSDKTKISVGKNNFQNDRLTLKTASKNDIWLHAKNVPGSHVIIHKSDPTQQTLLEAANLAAYFSKSRQSATVPVDYVMVKRIRKPNGARPGFVIYEGQKTLFVTPEPELIKKLAIKPNN